MQAVMYALRLLAFTLFVLAGCYLALSPLVATPVYNALLFYPAGYPNGHYDVEWVAGIRRQEVFFPSANGNKLHGWFFENQAANKTVLVSHGNGGNLTHRLFLAKHLLLAGASVFLYDYQGYGRSEGTPSLAGIVADARSAYKYLVDKRHIPPARIVLYGESLGTGVTCELQKMVSCAGVILQSGFASLRAIAKEKLHLLAIYPDWLFPTPALDNASVLKAAHPPLLIMHGLKDRFLPPQQSELVFKEASAPKLFVPLPQAAHDNAPVDPAYLPALKEFFATLSS